MSEQSLYDYETRRRAMLKAMQVDLWLPRQALPFAGASQALVLDFEPAPVPSVTQVNKASSAQEDKTLANQPVKQKIQAPKVALTDLKQQLAEPVEKKHSAVEIAKATESSINEQTQQTKQPIPRFALQLMRAGRCLLLIDLRTSEGYQHSDPDYRLLLDMLRAARLDSAPMLVRNEPIVWPMLTTGNLAATQNAQVATEAVQYLLKVELQKQPADCIWLLGRNAMRFAAELDEQHYYQLQQHAELGAVWALPSLELILDEPLRKADIWRSMQANWQVWSE
ncbi:energy transducer TonB [Pseudomonas sp. F1_0610]|uniref:energy transducer TonB n=1 Tax=Pseudomonas sp. F1_0610 TaxID=3114284 RepID=UPI0039C35041